MHTDDSDLSIVHVTPEQPCQLLIEEISSQVSEQHRPILVVLPNQPVQAFRRPDDFLPMKHLKRRLDIPIFFVIPMQGKLRSWAERYGFVTYPSQDAFFASTEQQLPSADAMTAVPAELSHPTKELDRSSPFSDSTEDQGASRPLADLLETSSDSSLPVASTASQQETHDTLALLETKPRQTTPLDPSLLSGLLDPLHSSIRDQEPVNPHSAPISREELQQTDEELEQITAPLPQRAPTFPPPTSTIVPARWLTRGRLMLAALIVLAIITATSPMFISKHLQPNAASSPAIVGSLYFQSSGQFNLSGNEGLNDGIIIDLHSIAPPGPGKSYHAWLLGDRNSSDGQAIFLGALDVAGNTAHCQYVNPQHINLLTLASTVVITEDENGNVPTYPFDQSSWRFEGAVPQTSDPNDKVHHFSVLDHLRHLLADEPNLEEIGLRGGLDTWFYRDSAKLVEWTGSARDSWGSKQTDLIHRQLIRTLDYLDGLNEVQQDVPRGTPFIVDRVQNRVGLLELSPGSFDPPGLIYAIQMHLTSLDVAPGRTNEQHILVRQIMDALTRTVYWLQQARQLAKELLIMSSQQLLSATAHSMLNDLATAANNAYQGRPDPATGSTQGGAFWVHMTLQRLASIEIMPYRA